MLAIHQMRSGSSHITTDSSLLCWLRAGRTWRPVGPRTSQCLQMPILAPTQLPPIFSRSIDDGPSFYSSCGYSKAIVCCYRMDARDLGSAKVLSPAVLMVESDLGHIHLPIELVMDGCGLNVFTKVPFSNHLV